jgi:hypothetical protein
MKVDSIFCSNLVPKLSLAATVNTMQLTVYNHMENMHSGKENMHSGYRTMPYHIIPYHTTQYHTMPYHTISYHISYHIPYHTMPTIPHNTIPCRTIPYRTIPCHADLKSIPIWNITCHIIPLPLFHWQILINSHTFPTLAIAEKFKGYTLQDEIPKSQEYLRVMAENSAIFIKSWPTDTMQCLVWSNAHADVLDYRELRWKSLLSPVDVTLAFVKCNNIQVCIYINCVWEY